MDATHSLLTRTAIFLAVAMLLAAPLAAQTLTASPTVLQFNNCPNHGYGTVSVTADAAATFTIAAPSWLRVTSNTAAIDSTHPATLAVDAISAFDATATVKVLVGGIDKTSFTVTWTSISPASCSVGSGSGGLSVEPTTLQLTGFQPGTITLENHAAAAISYTVVSDAAWLPVPATAGSGTLAASQKITITFTPVAQSGGQPATITVTPAGGSPITISVTGTGGTGNGSLTFTDNGTSTIAVPILYTAGDDIPGRVVIPLQSSTGALNYGFTVTTQSGGNWLFANGQVSHTLTDWPLTEKLQVWLNPAVVPSLATGTYSGTITLAASDGATATVNVTLTANGGSAATGVTVAPASYTFSVPAGSTTQQQTVFTLTATATDVSFGNVLQPSCANNWLSITNGVTSTGITVTATANPTGLPNATYMCSITVPSTSGTGDGTTLIPVTLTVGGGSGGTGATAAVAPNSLTFTYWTGKAVLAGLMQVVAVAGPQGASYTIGTTPSWIKLDLPTSGIVPGKLTVRVDPNGLLASSTAYTGVIPVTIGTTTLNVSVNFTIESGLPTITTFPAGDAILTYQSGGAVDTPTIYLSGSDGTVPAVTLGTISETWLKASLAGNGLTISADPSGLVNGIYTGSVTVTAPAGTYANSPLVIPVVLVVNGGGSSGGPLTLSTSSISLSAPVNGQGATADLAVSASQSTDFRISTSTSSGGNWLSLQVNLLAGTSPVTSGTTYTTNRTFKVLANPAGLAAGTYNGKITLVSGASTQEVQVVFSVTTTSGGATGNITANPATIAFTAQEGASSTTPQTIHLVNATQGTAAIPVTLSISGGTWLTAAFTGGANPTSTPADVTVTANPSGLTAAGGPYNGTITLTPNGGGTPVPVQVTLTVQAQPMVSLSSSALSFTYQVGGANPPAGSLQVTSNQPDLPFTAAATSTGNWLAVTPVSGTTPATLTVTVTPGTLATGTYNGTITVNGTGGASGTATANVVLKITAPLPRIDKIINSATGAIATSIAPGEIVSLFASTDGTAPIGPATAVGLQLNDSGAVSTSIGGVQVLFNGIAAPLAYVSATQINAVVPYEVARFANVSVWVKFLGQTSNQPQLSVSPTSPGLFTSNGTGSGAAAILNQDYSYNGSSNPAAKGSTIVLYMTGEGQTQPAGVTGKVTTVATTGPLTPQPLLPVAVNIDGQPATVAFWGEAPGLVSGVMQLNVVVPATARSGNVAVFVSFLGGNSSPAGVTVSVK